MVERLAGQVSRSEVVRAARGWLGTPYHHQASVRGVGTDCLGLVRGVWRELYGFDAEKPPAYAPDWAEATGEETMLAAAGRHLVPVPIEDRDAGDVVVFRYRKGIPAKHCGVLTGPGGFIHAMEGGPVCEVALSPWWARRIAGVFSLPYDGLKIKDGG